MIFSSLIWTCPFIAVWNGHENKIVRDDSTEESLRKFYRNVIEINIFYWSQKRGENICFFFLFPIYTNFSKYKNKEIHKALFLCFLLPLHKTLLWGSVRIFQMSRRTGDSSRTFAYLLIIGYASKLRNSITWSAALPMKVEGSRIWSSLSTIGAK